MLHSRSTITHRLTGSAPKILALASILITTGLAQEAPTLQKPAPVDPILGFESAKAWVVKSATPLTTAATATKRTQGALSLALGNPSGNFTMTSMAVASTSPALSNLDETGSVFQLDVMPAAKITGTMQLALTSPSRGLHAAIAGEADLKALRPGIFNTVSFPIPDGIRRALLGGPFQDLSFELVLKSGSTAAAPSMLFDNLRVSPISLVTLKAGVTKPANFGGSVNLKAIGDEPVKQTFDIGAVQVPEAFRLTEGTAAGTSVKLVLGHDGTAAYTCTYDPDDNDKTDQSYRIASCTDGVKAGDLLGANSAELTIVGGTTQKLQAQLAQNPAGALVGGDVIPPMPTYWGRADGCAPSSQPGVISASCAAQVDEANQIVTSYFDRVKASNPGRNFIVAPVADRALRHDVGFADGGIVTAPPQGNNVPFHKEGHLNPGGDFDAYWRLNGDLNSTNDAATGDSSTHFDVDFSGHVVVFGEDVNVASLNATVDTKSGSAPSATASVHYFLFGQELPGGGTFNPTTGLNSNNTSTKSYNVLTLEHWVFKLTVDAVATVTLKTTGTLAPTGLNVTVTPEASMSVHVFGGVDVEVASGGVDGTVQLLDVKVPVTAQAGVAANNNPNSCALIFSFSLDGEVTISSLGGEIDLKATFLFVIEETETLLKWDPILSTTQTLFKVGPLTAAAPLPLALCTPTVTSTITSPGDAVNSGLAIPLAATNTASAGTGSFSCSDRIWTVVPDEPITKSANGCQTSIQFNNPGAHTLTVKTTLHFIDQFNRTITASAAASKVIRVTVVPAGAHIISMSPAPTGIQPPYDKQTVSLTVPVLPAKIQIGGEFVGSTPVQLSWTVTDAAGHTSAIPTGTNPAMASWAPLAPGVYTIKLTATDSTGKVAGSSVMVVKLATTILL